MEKHVESNPNTLSGKHTCVVGGRARALPVGEELGVEGGEPEWTNAEGEAQTI
jgi:hypothetical protein